MNGLIIVIVGKRSFYDNVQINQMYIFVMIILQLLELNIMKMKNLLIFILDLGKSVHIVKMKFLILLAKVVVTNLIVVK